jgi:hypothetical protein
MADALAVARYAYAVVSAAVRSPALSPEKTLADILYRFATQHAEGERQFAVSEARHAAQAEARRVRGELERSIKALQKIEDQPPQT